MADQTLALMTKLREQFVDLESAALRREVIATTDDPIALADELRFTDRLRLLETSGDVVELHPQWRVVEPGTGGRVLR